MEEQERDNVGSTGRRGSQRSARSTTSADQAMQRVASRFIAATESARELFREREESTGRPWTSYDSTARPSDTNGPQTPARPASLGEGRTANLTTAFQTAPGANGSSERESSSGNGHSRATSEGSPPLPPWPQGGWPSVQSSPVPPAQDAHPVPEPEIARISIVTPPPPLPLPEPEADARLIAPPPPVVTTGDWPVSSGSTPTVMAFSQPMSLAPSSSRSNKNIEIIEPPLRYLPYRPSSISNAGSRPITQDITSTPPDWLPVEEKRTSKYDDGKPAFSLFHEICFVVMICLAQLLMFAALAQALAPAQRISQAFPGTQRGYLSWYSASFALAAGAFALPAGRFGTLFGHKKVFVVGFFWFSLWSVLAGISPYVEKGGANGSIYFCVCRAMQGIGPALIVPNGQALLGRAYALGPRRNLVMCLFGAAAPTGFVVGAVMASLFAQLMSWEWAFFVLGAVCLTLACQSMIILPRDSVPTKKMGVSYLTLMDAPGIILGVSGLALFAFSWNHAPVVGWATSYIYFLLIIGALLMGTFIYLESRSKYPLLPISAMNATTTFVLACTTAGWGCFSVWVFYTFQFIVSLRGWTPLLASAGFSGIPLVGLGASILVAYLLRRITPYRLMLIAMAAFLAGSALMAFAPVNQTYWLQTFLSILCIPVGMNVSNPVSTVLVSNSVPREHQGMAGSLVLTAVFAAVSVSLGMAGTVESNVNHGGEDVERGYRGALLFAVGLAGLGLVLAAGGVVADALWPAEPEEGAALHIGKGRKGKEKEKEKGRENGGERGSLVGEA